MPPSKELTADSMDGFYTLPDNALATPNEAAAFLRIKYATLAWYRCQGEGPTFVRIGPKLIRYRLGDLRAYANGRQMSDGVRKTGQAMLAARTHKVENNT